MCFYFGNTGMGKHAAGCSACLFSVFVGQFMLYVGTPPWWFHCVRFIKKKNLHCLNLREVFYYYYFFLPRAAVKSRSCPRDYANLDFSPLCSSFAHIVCICRRRLMKNGTALLFVYLLACRAARCSQAVGGYTEGQGDTPAVGCVCVCLWASGPCTHFMSDGMFGCTGVCVHIFFF